jgi:raffinose/stachyose/melibiose transport system substrate-binding protein
MTPLSFLSRALLSLSLLAAGSATAGSLSIESWRIDDKALWETVLIPAFVKKHPGIQLRFVPSAPAEYDAAVNARLAAGTAGDLIACRPFDRSQDLYRQGRLFRLDGKAGMNNFAPAATAPWQSADTRHTYCMPIASVIHGFIYNKRIFKALNLQAPTTQAEFFAVLDAIKRQGEIAPLALGLAERWEANQTAFMNVGPNYWRGESGRKALIGGSARFTDPQFVGAFELVAKMGPYLAKDAASHSYADSQNLFASGGAAIYPAGSWDIARFRQVPDLELGVFPPPVRQAGDKCYVTDHMDIGLGVNRKSRNRDDALKFLEWVGSQEFADLYTNRATGFFSLSTHLIAVRDPLAKQMADWRATCDTTMRLNAHILDQGVPSMEDELRQVNGQLLSGKITAKAAAERIDQGLSRWYSPGQKASMPPRANRPGARTGQD